MDKSRTCFVGIDESNHGKYPEIFVGVFSTDPRDKQPSYFPKNRESDYNFLDELGNRVYCFSLLRKKDKSKILDKDLEGIATSSLIYPFSNNNPGLNYEIYWDGKKKPSEVNHIKEMVCNKCGIESEDIYIEARKELDESLYIVNLADSIASQLFRESNLRRKNNFQVPFLY